MNLEVRLHISSELAQEIKETIGPDTDPAAFCQGVLQQQLEEGIRDLLKDHRLQERYASS